MTEAILKAITLYQPHATLVVLGEKRIETRPRKWGFVGQVAIHASLSHKWMHLCETEPFKSALSRHGLTSGDLDFGYVLGEVYKTGCFPTETMGGISSLERDFGDYSPGRFAYTTEHFIRYQVPRLARGQQGIWEWYRDSEVV